MIAKQTIKTFFVSTCLCQLIAIAALPTTAAAQSITQQIETKGDLTTGPFPLTFEPFDSMNGTRALESVTVEFDGFVDLDILITNYTSLDLDFQDWFYDAGANMLLAFSSKPGFEDGGPFYGLGGVFESGITGVLSAGSGGPPPPFGNPTAGEITVSASMTNDFESTVNATSFLSYFTTDETLNATISPFLDFIVSMPEAEPNGYIEATTELLEFEGTLSLTYNWIDPLGRPEDCNQDGIVDALDLSCVCGESFAAVEDILSAANLLSGDLDLDGDVGFADFLTLSTNFGTAGNYLNGDLDCNGNVGFGDFLILAGNFGQTTNELQSVPEPNNHSILPLLGFLGLIMHRRLGRK